MILIKRGMATEENIGKITKIINESGLKYRVTKGQFDTIIYVIGDESDKISLFETIASYEFVERAHPLQSNVGYKLIARENIEEFRGNIKTSRFNIGNVEIGNGKTVVIAGPCAVQSKEQTLEIAENVKNAGADMLRGGAFKPRTSPYG
ncbi:MAG: 3-deoxy-7-phosphoheptulonate synthase, partial [Nanobdellota archaeon]